jgi:hypothetical protein
MAGMAEITDTQKQLLAMQSNIDQMSAAIRSALADQECGHLRADVEEMRNLILTISAKIEATLQSLENNTPSAH